MKFYKVNTKRLFSGLLPVLFSLLFCSSPVDNQQYFTDPSEINLITSDITNFWKAYDSVSSDTSLNASYIYNQIYFNNASTGLKDFCRIKEADNNAFKSIIFTKYPKFYASIRNRSQEIASYWSKINLKEFFHSFDSIIPDARYLDIFFIIGNLSSGGRISQNGIIISLEFFSLDEKTDISEIDSLFSRVLSTFSDPDNFESILIHELVHVNQTIRNPNNILLNQCIIEGGADFITYLVNGTILNNLAHQYGTIHEKKIWQDFQIEMEGNNYNKWLYNQLNYSKDKAPDLGYFIGFKICESFYQNTEDKKAAIKRILNPNNYNEFLIDSKYNPLK